MDEIVKLILELAEERGLSTHQVLQTVREHVYLEVLVRRISTPVSSGKIVMVSTPHTKMPNRINMAFMDDLEYDTPFRENYTISEGFDLGTYENKYKEKFKEIGEYKGFRFIENETVPPGMSPSFHHIMQKERKKKGKK